MHQSVDDIDNRVSRKMNSICNISFVGVLCCLPSPCPGGGLPSSYQRPRPVHNQRSDGRPGFVPGNGSRETLRVLIPAPRQVFNDGDAVRVAHAGQGLCLHVQQLQGDHGEPLSLRHVRCEFQRFRADTCICRCLNNLYLLLLQF